MGGMMQLVRETGSRGAAVHLYNQSTYSRRTRLSFHVTLLLVLWLFYLFTVLC